MGGTFFSHQRKQELSQPFITIGTMIMVVNKMLRLYTAPISGTELTFVWSEFHDEHNAGVACTQ